MRRLYIFCCFNCQHKPFVTKAFVTNNPVFCHRLYRLLWQRKSNRLKKSTDQNALVVIINSCVYNVDNVCIVSIHLLFVLPNDWSVGSGMEDGRPHIPPNLLKKEDNPPSDPSTPGEQKYTKLLRLIHTSITILTISISLFKICHRFNI